MPRQECPRLRPGEGKKSLEAGLLAAEQALRFQSLQIEPVEEWPISIGRRASSCKVDRIAVLPNYRGSVRQLASHRTAGVRIVLVRREIPEQTRFLLPTIDVDNKRPSPVPVVIVFVHERGARLLAPHKADVTLLRPCDFGRGCGERRFEKHDSVA